jgi:thiamine-monophosphate kinase
MGELSLIEKFRAGAPEHPWITVGPGSDCAALNWPATDEILFKIDQVVEGTHFTFAGKHACTPYGVGWKAMAKACSDIAAAGGWPVAAMVAMNVRKGSNETLALEVYEGLVACCERYEIGLAGGDFSTSDNGLSISVSLLGRCKKGDAWTRNGAKPRDALLVTGDLGGSLQSGRHCKFLPCLELAKEVREFCPDGVHACIDITDGLSRDLWHICKESKCGARIEETLIPLNAVEFSQALSDGEDFELLLAIEREQAQKLLDVKSEQYIPALTQIGEIMPQSHGVTVVSKDGAESPLPDIGYEHHV